MKINMGQKWYQLIAYDLLFSRWVFFYLFKEPWPFNLKKTFFRTLINFRMACLVNVASAASLRFREGYNKVNCVVAVCGT
jgi:hypothetical protein